MEASESGPKIPMVNADPNGKMLKKFEVVRDRNVQIQDSSRGGVMGGVVHDYSERLCFNRVLLSWRRDLPKANLIIWAGGDLGASCERPFILVS
jgi:hypothetical protein